MWRKWVKAPTPGPWTGSLNSVSCTSLLDCAAVGTYGLYVETNGKWAFVKPSLPPDTAAAGTYALTSVSCVRGTGCTAVGDYESSSGLLPLVVTQSGTTWSGSPVSLPSGASAKWGASLEEVSCSTGTSCSVAGLYLTPPGLGRLWFVSEVAGTWGSGHNGVLPAGATASSGQIFGISCPTTNFCVAAGDYSHAWGTKHIQEWSGVTFTETHGAWSRGVPTSVPSNSTPRGDARALPQSQDLGISCPSESLCTIVGTYRKVPNLYTSFATMLR